MPRSHFSAEYAIVVARKGKPQSFFSKIERGERRVDVLEFCELVRALGFKPAEVLGVVDVRLLDAAGSRQSWCARHAAEQSAADLKLELHFCRPVVETFTERPPNKRRIELATRG